MFIKPYSDEYMTYNEKREHYVLTAKAVLDHLGIDLNVNVKDNANGVNALFTRVSELTYRKMHEYGDNTEQDRIIATTKSGRNIIFNAMLEQFFYVKSVGDLSLSTNRDERALYASDALIEIFEEIIPEIGRSVISISRC